MASICQGGLLNHCWREDVDEKSQRDRQVLLTPAECGSTSGTGQPSPASLSGLAIVPVVWRKAKPNSVFSVRYAWIAASERVAGRPRLPLGMASHSVLKSGQISSEPRCLRGAL